MAEFGTFLVSAGVVSGLGAAAWLYARLKAKRTRLATEAASRAIAVAEALVDPVDHEYLRSSAIEAWEERYPKPERFLLDRSNLRRLRDPDMVRRYNQSAAILTDPRQWARKRNAEFVHDEMIRFAAWFDTRFGTPLTESQRRAVLTDEDANLVVAGAGSGKTVTLLAKVAYLIEKRGVDPRSILMLAFNRSIAEEIAERLEALGIPGPEVSTFHAKGYGLVARATGRRPAISALADDPHALHQFFEDVIQIQLNDPVFFKRFQRWWVELRVEAWELRADSPDERLRKERSLGLTTLVGTSVRSQSEAKVGDWLTLAGIRWIHEARYDREPGNAVFRDYTPDFYLPDDEVWIEVWACDEEEKRFPPEIDADGYRQGMVWKRDVHRRHGTVLVEINQTDIWRRSLGEVLKARLAEVQVSPRPIGESEIQALVASSHRAFDPLVRLMASFLRLYRAGGWDREALGAKAATDRDRDFLELFWPFLDAYEDRLSEEGKIDFDAMLIEAARELEVKPTHTYEYILVDEYQDTSRARMELIRRLRGQHKGCRLVLVGDDWQSIYRFTGSDLSYFTDAKAFFGATERIDLADTFRLVPDVAELSSEFVQRNPNQLRKNITAHKQGPNEPGVSVRLHLPGGEDATLRALLDEIEAQAGPSARLLILSRYNFQLDLWRRIEEHRQCQIPSRALTVHRSKGLEASHVIVLGLSTGMLGFPTEIEDDRVLQLLLGDEEPFPNSEERRLFYVALTRSSSRVHLLADAIHTSPFIQELLSDEYAPWIDLYGEESRRYLCPRCRGRTIRRREGEYGAFWACINYSACRGRLTVCPVCETGVLEPIGTDLEPSGYRCTACSFSPEVCPLCHTGAVVKRVGRHGPFQGCTEWRPGGGGCGYTRDVRE